MKGRTEILGEENGEKGKKGENELLVEGVIRRSHKKELGTVQ